MISLNYSATGGGEYEGLDLSGEGTLTVTLNGVSWDSVKFYCAANGDSDLTKQFDYEELKNKGAFAAISSH